MTDIQPSHIEQEATNTAPPALKQTRRSSAARSQRSKKVVISDNNDKLTRSQRSEANNDTLKTTALKDTGTSKNLLKKRATKPAYLQSLNESEKAENFKIIDSMNKKISYLKNPRHKTSKAPILMTQAIKDAALVENTQHETSFRVEPPCVQFMDYQVNGIYEIAVKVTNLASVSKRIKFIPPASEMFTVRRVKYPSINTGDVAPGMALTFAVTFQAPSFADFDDFVTLITEENSFKLPLRARREPPIINLVNPMNCLNSWLGDRVDMAFRCVNNGGDGGFKFFCERDEDDSKQTDADTIKISSFTITPSEFYLYSGNAIDIYVSFAPEAEGELSENLILACDNQTSEFYKVTGMGAMLDLDIIEVDGKEVDFKINSFETMFFQNTNPTSVSTRNLKIKNSSNLPVIFHWSIYKQKNSEKISLEEQQTHFKVTPSQGKFKGGESLEFEVSFFPEHADPYFEFADLIVEDIPINAIRAPPEGLKDFVDENKQQSKVPMPTYVGSNTQFLSIPVIQFNLRGQGNSCGVEVFPPVTFFEGDNYINYTYKEIIQLRKISQGNVKYKLWLEAKNRDTFEVDVRTRDGKSIQGGQSVIEGKIDGTDSIDLEIQIKSEERGKALAYFMVEIEDGPPVSFQCQADFRGPIVEIHEPLVDLGLTKVNTESKFSITLENKSPIPASFIIKNANNKKMTIDNAIMFDETSGISGGHSSTSQASLVAGRPIKTKGGNYIQFETSHRTLAPFQKTVIHVYVKFFCQESIKEFFEIMVKESKSIFMKMFTEVQKPRVYLNRQEVSLGKIYAGVKEVVDLDVGKHKSQSLQLINYGNLPVNFNWEELNDPKKAVIRFEPRQGTIPPKSKVKISFEMTVFTGGQIDELLICDIEDLEMPLGLEVKADAFGLNVAYMTNEDQSLSSLSHVDSGSIEDHMSVYDNMNKLQILNFTSCVINKPSKQTFVLKNLSGIQTRFNFKALNFEPISHVAPQQKSEIQQALEAERQRQIQEESKKIEMAMKRRSTNSVNKQIRFAASAKTTGMSSTRTEKRRSKPILSDEHEQTQKFSSATGNTYTQTKNMEKEQAYFLSNNKGLAVVFSPQVGELPPNSEVPVTVTIYNNICGKFDDKIISQVEGLPPIEFPVRVAINGSPVVIPPNQVGLNYNTIPATLPMPTIVNNSAPIQKTFKIKNTGIRALQVDWRIFDSKDLENVDNDAFKLSIIKNQSFDKRKYPFKFNFQAVEPEESQNSAFEISPKNVTISSRSVQEFTVNFDPSHGVGNFNSILLATPDLAQEEYDIADSHDDLPKKGTLGNISLNLKATTIAPFLTLDKTTKMSGEKHVKIKQWAIVEDDCPKNVTKLTFSNTSKADMTFNLSASGPFEIVKTKSNTGAKHPLAQGTPQKQIKKKIETLFVLQPLKICEVSLRFNAPKPNQTADWPMIMRNERHGELTANFANGDSQKINLDGVLLRPKLVLLTEKAAKNDKAMDELSFGVCNVDMHRTIKVFLSNITEVTAKWQLNYVKFAKKTTISKYTTTRWENENMEKVDDPDVFEFSVTDGQLKGKSYPLRKMPEGLCVPPIAKDDYERQFVPQTILVNFRPKRNVLYKSKFRFTVEQGLSCDIILKGEGSYEENAD